MSRKKPHIMLTEVFHKHTSRSQNKWLPGIVEICVFYRGHKYYCRRSTIDFVCLENDNGHELCAKQFWIEIYCIICKSSLNEKIRKLYSTYTIANVIRDIVSYNYCQSVSTLRSMGVSFSRLCCSCCTGLGFHEPKFTQGFIPGLSSYWNLMLIPSSVLGQQVN